MNMTGYEESSHRAIARLPDLFTRIAVALERIADHLGHDDARVEEWHDRTGFRVGDLVEDAESDRGEVIGFDWAKGRDGTPYDPPRPVVIVEGSAWPKGGRYPADLLRKIGRAA